MPSFHGIKLSGRPDGSVRCIAPGTWVMFPVSWEEKTAFLDQIRKTTNQKETGHALILSSQSCNASYSCNWNKELTVYKLPYSFVWGPCRIPRCQMRLGPSRARNKLPSCLFALLWRTCFLSVGSEIRARCITFGGLSGISVLPGRTTLLVEGNNLVRNWEL